jgi:hypothetical protein
MHRRLGCRVGCTITVTVPPHSSRHQAMCTIITLPHLLVDLTKIMDMDMVNLVRRQISPLSYQDFICLAFTHHSSYVLNFFPLLHNSFILLGQHPPPPESSLYPVEQQEGERVGQYPPLAPSRGPGAGFPGYYNSSYPQYGHGY